ncbi:MAG TPA: nicotinate phosphoribosyltransferase [Syntrophobacteraceae bacterium]|nr:nicotinate phosphoribosyltransferase [Syntrophobacteraceae bacterium]
MNPWERYAPELVADLYEITMAESYLREGMNSEATFSLFIRDYPPDRSYFVSAGLESLLNILADFHFSDESLRYLASLRKFSTRLIDRLRNFRFSGTIRAIPEGRIFFAQEPVLEVTAPILEAQLLETLVVNVIQLETMLATKAARVSAVASGKGLIDFGMRRTQGVDASLKAARASYLAGFLGTSNLLAGKIYDIPVFGTMAHSYITSFHSELDAFHAFARAFPDNSVLLIDTYDCAAGALKAVEVATALRKKGKSLLGVRLDSGDLADLSRQVRLILDKAGFPDVKIMASGSLDEYQIEKLQNSGAKIDFYAVGTRMGVSADAPCLDIVYKLVEYDGKPILKLSAGKKTWIGKKQVCRFYSPDGKMDFDRVCLLGSEEEQGEPLMELVVEAGRRVQPPESLMEIRERFSGEWSKLPEKLRSIHPAQVFPVQVCPSLVELDSEIARIKRREEVEPFTK